MKINNCQRDEENFLAVEAAKKVWNYSDLEDYFEEYPGVTLLVRMPSGHNATITSYSFDQLLREHNGDYKDTEDYDMDNFEVVSVLRNNEYIDRKMKETE